MRIVAGEFRGRKLHPPKGMNIRPTGDRVREAIFNIIGPRLPKARVLDLFAGTGALGLEALSRGAAQAVFVDENAEAIRLISINIKNCGAQDRTLVIQGPVKGVLRRLAKNEESSEKFQFIFLDPPYGKGYVEKTLGVLAELAAPNALVVAEHHAKDVFSARLGEWLLTQERKYGDTKVSFFVRDIPEPS